MSMRAPRANRRTSLGGFPGIFEIAAGANSGRQNEAGDPSRIRTCNPRSRNPLLYPVELWDRCRLHSIANMKNPLPGQARFEPFSVTKRQTLQRWDRCVRPAVHAMLRRSPLPAPKGSLRHMLHATFSRPGSPAMSLSPFRAHLYITRPGAAQGAPT